jgi:hypothetical protein
MRVNATASGRVFRAKGEVPVLLLSFVGPKDPEFFPGIRATIPQQYYGEEVMNNLVEARRDLEDRWRNE